jgi:hypothetical protein
MSMLAVQACPLSSTSLGGECIWPLWIHCLHGLRYSSRWEPVLRKANSLVACCETDCTPPFLLPTIVSYMDTQLCSGSANVSKPDTRRPSASVHSWRTEWSAEAGKATHWDLTIVSHLHSMVVLKQNGSASSHLSCNEKHLSAASIKRASAFLQLYTPSTEP